MKKSRRLMSTVVFTDLSLNALLSFLVLFILSVININPPSKRDDAVETEGKFMVAMRWPDASADDVDLYVMGPLGSICFFRNQEVDLMHLEHDDLGVRSDTVTTSSGVVTVNKNEERVILRGIIPGEYVVNVHMYSKGDAGAVTVSASLNRLRGQDTEVVKRDRILRFAGDEETAFRFSLSESGSVYNINELPRPILGKAAFKRERR